VRSFSSLDFFLFDQKKKNNEAAKFVNNGG